MYALPEIKNHVAALKQLSALRMQRINKDALASDENPMPDLVKTWLAKLTLLYGLPFEHIAANSAMLPAESIRFFYVDPNWVNALTDGALSVGVQNSQEVFIQTAVSESVRSSIHAEKQTVRCRLAGAELPEEVEVRPVAGFLMRSELVAGWPGLEILPYSDTAGTQLVSILRLERIAPDVMLCLLADVPHNILIREPKEALSFGVTGGLSGTGMLARYLGAKPDQPVADFLPAETSNYVKPVLRDSALRVFNATATRDGFKQVLQNNNALRPGTTTLSPADFAIQIVKVSEEQRFISGLQTGANDCSPNS